MELETKTVEMKIRVCDNCGFRAVALEGPETDCPDCRVFPHDAAPETGDLTYYNGDTQNVELTEDQIEDVPDSEIENIED